MSNEIRKNASLTAVAEAARKRANRMRRKWSNLLATARERWNERDGHEWKLRAEDAQEAMHDLEEIAHHLERLAGIPHPAKASAFGPINPEVK